MGYNILGEALTLTCVNAGDNDRRRDFQDSRLDQIRHSGSPGSVSPGTPALYLSHAPHCADHGPISLGPPPPPLPSGTQALGDRLAQVAVLCYSSHHTQGLRWDDSCFCGRAFPGRWGRTAVCSESQPCRDCRSTVLLCLEMRKAAGGR